MNINSDMLLKNLYMTVLFVTLSGSAASMETKDVEQNLETEKWHKVSDTRLAFSRGGLYYLTVSL